MFYDWNVSANMDQLFDEDPMTHIRLKHGGPALKELAKTLE